MTHDERILGRDCGADLLHDEDIYRERKMSGTAKEWLDLLTKASKKKGRTGVAVFLTEDDIERIQDAAVRRLHGDAGERLSLLEQAKELASRPNALTLRDLLPFARDCWSQGYERGAYDTRYGKVSGPNHPVNLKDSEG